jgi:preprotein translocase subunit SecD
LIRLAGIVLLLASPAVAEPALISFEFAEDTIVATGEDIEIAESAFDLNNLPVLKIELHKGFDARFAALSVKNIGRVLTVRICGEVIIQPTLQSTLSVAKFQITATSVEEATRLAEQLKTRSCPDQPLG